MFDRLFFIMIMNRLHCESRVINCERMRAGASTGFIPLPTVEATPLGHEDNQNCKRFAFICVHSIKKNLCFFVR